MTITIFTPNGEATDYRTVSERLPEFDRKFPIQDGYRVIRSHISAKDFGSDLIHLYEVAISNGHSARDVGLPFIEGFGVIFKAELFKGETLIRNASAYKQVTQTKDWEAGETAAFQRLMAACGLGGTDMDADDQYDRITSGLELPPESKSDSAQQRATPRVEEPIMQEEAQTPPAENLQSEVPAEAPQGEPEAPKAQKKKSDPAPAADLQKPQTDAAEEIRPQLLNQLSHVAKLAGEPVPEVSTVKEAKAEIKRLNALSRSS